MTSKNQNYHGRYLIRYTTKLSILTGSLEIYSYNTKICINGLIYIRRIFKKICTTFKIVLVTIRSLTKIRQHNYDIMSRSRATTIS